MRRPGVIATVLALVAVVSLLGASDVRGGGGGLTPPGKTTGPGVIATIVTDVTGGSFADGKGWTAIQIQRASASAAVQFQSSFVHGFANQCTAGNLDNVATTRNRFVNLVLNALVDNPGVLASLLQNFGNPNNAVITNVDFVACGPMNFTDIFGNPIPSATRQILSFTAVIQFIP